MTVAGGDVVQVCAWCRRDLVTGAPVDETDPRPVSHGVCPSCSDRLLLRKVDLDKFLALLPGAVYFVAEDRRMGGANEAACRLAGKSLREVQGHLGGDVFECLYASQPGGCGRTDHCNGCTMRQAVAHTLETGGAITDRLAYSFHRVDGRVERRSWRISTERFRDGVLLAVVRV